ncbi:hypothetical protein FC789_12890 [Clostridium botulinum]|nr:hypothetical protein [Clostridium botulinum]
MLRLEKPIITIETIKAMEDMSYFTHALIFDDLLIIAQKRMSYMPNIYLIGQSGFRKYCQLFRNLCYERLVMMK